MCFRDLFLCTCCFFCSLLTLSCQVTPADRFNLVPVPTSVVSQTGRFVLNKEMRIFYPARGADWATVVEYLKGSLEPATGFQFKSQTGKAPAAQANAIFLVEDAKITNPEGYVLEVKRNAITIKAGSPAGAFYAVQTLKQLLPPAIYQNSVSKNVSWLVPCATITDAPRFGYRGMHLDVGRHFFSVSFIKRYIDLMAAHKINRFHWHLTEDQGWRIEIKKYPKLQTVASCRAQTLIGHDSDVPVKMDGKPHCGYYTQEEVKEVVEYARKQFVTIVPEIEMPGHATAALAAYPELGCTGGPYKVIENWGVFDDVFCAGNEQTFVFLKDVLTEVAALFPGTYVHVGGDECPKVRWKTCAKCQKRMQTEGLKDEHALQSYFIGRAEQILSKLGKKLIGWDEILEGGLSPNATVMSWRGVEGGIEAAKQRHDVIMTPTSNCYLDYYQSDPENEPLAIGGFLPLEKVYQYEPVPAELNAEEAKHILGVQGNVWTEYMETPEKVEYMVYPRACAIAESGWTAKAKKNWPNFGLRMKTHFERLAAMKVNYSKAYYDLGSTFQNGKLSLLCLDPSAQIFYTLNGSVPTTRSIPYKGPVSLEQSSVVKAVAFINDQPMGNVYTLPFRMHKASGKPYILSRQPEKYTGSEKYALTNGLIGAMKTWNNWVGLVNHDIDPIIDFGVKTSFKKVSLQYVNGRNSWIYPPTGVLLFVSDDGKTFQQIAQRSINTDKIDGTKVEQVTIDLPETKTRYLKVVVKTFGVIPEDEEGAGNGAWLFVDEVVVE